MSDATALVVVGADEPEEYADPRLIHRVYYETATGRIVATEASHIPSIVMPGTSYVDTEDTFGSIHPRSHRVENGALVRLPTP